MCDVCTGSIDKKYKDYDIPEYELDSDAPGAVVISDNLLDGEANEGNSISSDTAVGNRSSSTRD